MTTLHLLPTANDWQLVQGASPRRRAETLIGGYLASFSNQLTRRNRRQVLKEFLAFLDSIGVEDPVSEVRRFHIDAWLRWVESIGNKPATVAQKIAGVAGFYRYLLIEELIERDPTIHVKRPRISKESTRDYLTPRELADFVTEAENIGGYPYLAVCLLVYNALRVSEACNADIEHLGRDKHHTTLLVTRKGGKEELIALPGPTVTAVKEAITDRTYGPLLLNRAYNRMTRESVASIVQRLCNAAHIYGKRVTPHSLRHSSITAYLISGASTDDAAAFASHDDIRSTKVYDRRVRKLDAHGSYSVVSTIASYQR